MVKAECGPPCGDTMSGGRDEEAEAEAEAGEKAVPAEAILSIHKKNKKKQEFFKK